MRRGLQQCPERLRPKPNDGSIRPRVRPDDRAANNGEGASVGEAEADYIDLAETEAGMPAPSGPPAPPGGHGSG